MAGQAKKMAVQRGDGKTSAKQTRIILGGGKSLTLGMRGKSVEENMSFLRRTGIFGPRP